MKFPSHDLLKEFLDEKYALFCRPEFIAEDPISIPHRFSKKEDIEISGFLSAIIAWGNRKSILKSAAKMMELMDNDPYAFVLHHSHADLKHFKDFVHRTFNDEDLMTIVQCLQELYKNHGGLESAFKSGMNHEESLRLFPKQFFQLEVPRRVEKHIAKTEKGSAAKRLNMFLRWMVRDNTKGVDFGLWKGISPSALYIPLDVHSGNSARQLGLLDRKLNDWKAVVELTENLRSFDPIDPVKYDYALFGMGVIEKTT